LRNYLILDLMVHLEITSSQAMRNTTQPGIFFSLSCKKIYILKNIFYVETRKVIYNIKIIFSCELLYLESAI
jgi:hypothetical protein